MPGIRYFWDFDGTIGRLYGALPLDAKPGSGPVSARRFWIVLDPMLRVRNVVPFRPDGSDRAEIAQAVNTLRFEKDGSVFGDNTDGAGLVHDIQHNLNVSIKDKQVLILGAGGAGSPRSCGT